MRKHGRALALAATLAALALAVGGCGGGDDESSDGATTAAAAETTEPTTTEEETTEEETTEETTGAATGIADEDCIELASIGAKFSEALGATGQNANFEATDGLPRAARRQGAGRDQGRSRGALGGLGRGGSGAQGHRPLERRATSAETLAKLQELGTKFNTPKLQQASKNLTAWSNEHCGTGTTTTP